MLAEIVPAAEAASPRVVDFEFQFVGVAAQLGSVHGRGLRRQGTEAAGDFSPHAVAHAVPAAGQLLDEECDTVVAQFDVRASSLPL